MTIYKFSDETEFKLSGSIHKEKKSDGWYIIGNEQEVKVKDETRANLYIEIYNRNKDKVYNIH